MADKILKISCLLIGAFTAAVAYSEIEDVLEEQIRKRQAARRAA